MDPAAAPPVREMLNLLYTVAFDPAGSGGTRQMAKMLAGSVARTYFTGDMVLIRNSPQPVFLMQRAGIEEHYVDTPALEHQELAEHAMAFKARARHCLPPPEPYGWVVFLDADCLCLRNLDHLFAEAVDADILYQPEPGRSMGDAVFSGYLGKDELRRMNDEGAKGGNVAPRWWGINSGTWAVRGHLYHAVMEEWEGIQNSKPGRRTKWTEQSAWNRLVLDAAQHGWRARPFEAHEIQFPLHLDKDWKLYRDAAVVHCVGGTNLQKIEFMFGLYMQRFFYDPACTLLNVLEM